VATQSDDFNRASLGANGPNGNAYQGLGTWSIGASTVLTAPTNAQGNTLVYNTTFADAFIEADILTGPASTTSGFAFRWTDSDNYLFLYWDPSGSLAMFKREAASETFLCSWSDTLVAPFNLKLRFSGNAFTVYADDVDLGTPDSGTASSAFNNTATRHGTYHFGNGSTAGTFDNWLLDSDATVPVTSSDSFTATEGGADVGLNSADTVALAEAWGIAIERAGGRLIADIARATETELVTVAGVDPLLARPLYALIETPPLTATIIDYLENVPDSAWRESGVDIDI